MNHCRPFKFRIWDKTDSAWVSGPCEYLQLEKTFDLLGATNRDNWIIQQYIGMQDNTGRDLYEGDIIEFDDTLIGGEKGIGEIMYDSDMMYFGPAFSMWVIDSVPDPEKPNRSTRGASPFPYGGKIIGNIFENPEILSSRPFSS